MEFTMHDVCRIRCGKIQKNERKNAKDKPFWTRTIRVTSDRGEAVELTMFADSEDCLYLLDSDRKCIEVPDAPPDCVRCKGTGQVADAVGTGQSMCPDCDGEGVAK